MANHGAVRQRNSSAMVSGRRDASIKKSIREKVLKTYITLDPSCKGDLCNG